MTTAQMPYDENNHPLPVLRVRPGGTQKIDVAVASARNITPFFNGIQVISLYATEDMFIRFGDAVVAAAVTDMFFPKGILVDIAIAGNSSQDVAFTHVAAIRATANGILYIAERF